MANKNNDSNKKDNGQRGIPTKDNGKFIHKKENVIVPCKKDIGGTESTGPKRLPINDKE
jgi:hypothetical protein